MPTKIRKAVTGARKKAAAATEKRERQAAFLRGDLDLPQAEIQELMRTNAEARAQVLGPVLVNKLNDEHFEVNLDDPDELEILAVTLDMGGLQQADLREPMRSSPELAAAIAELAGRKEVEVRS